MSKIADRLQKVKETIESACARAGRETSEVKLVVVTKSASIEAVEEIIRLGEVELGENRVQQLKKVSSQVEEFLQKGNGKNVLPERVSWHMIGHLQRNKIRQVLPIVSLIHSVDTLRLAEEIDLAAEKLGVKPRVLLQVNTSMEPQKYGIPVGAVTHLAEQLRSMENMRICGLMTMAPLTRNEDVVRSCFMRARELFLEMKGEGIVGRDFTELSMGMSNDYELAIEEGATILRIGSAIFAG